MKTGDDFISTQLAARTGSSSLRAQRAGPRPASLAPAAQPPLKVTDKTRIFFSLPLALLKESVLPRETHAHPTYFVEKKVLKVRWKLKRENRAPAQSYSWEEGSGSRPWRKELMTPATT